jgi:hypothetical protein
VWSWLNSARRDETMMPDRDAMKYWLSEQTCPFARLAL